MNKNILYFTFKAVMYGWECYSLAFFFLTKYNNIISSL